MTLTIGAAERGELAAMVEIYNHFVATSHCTFDTEAFTEATRSPWWAQFDGGRYRCLAAREGDALVGYACSMPLKAKPAYGTSVEVSVYVAPDRGGQGIGRGLYETLLAGLEGEDVHRAYALIALPNDPSIRLHEAFSFRKVAHLDEVGRKFDRYWDVAWYERGL